MSAHTLYWWNCRKTRHSLHYRWTPPQRDSYQDCKCISPRGHQFPFWTFIQQVSEIRYVSKSTHGGSECSTPRQEWPPWPHWGLVMKDHEGELGKRVRMKEYSVSQRKWKRKVQNNNDANPCEKEKKKKKNIYLIMKRRKKRIVIHSSFIYGNIHKKQISVVANG